MIVGKCSGGSRAPSYSSWGLGLCKPPTADATRRLPPSAETSSKTSSQEVMVLTRLTRRSAENKHAWSQNLLKISIPIPSRNQPWANEVVQSALFACETFSFWNRSILSIQNILNSKNFQGIFQPPAGWLTQVFFFLFQGIYSQLRGEGMLKSIRGVSNQTYHSNFELNYIFTTDLNKDQYIKHISVYFHWF